MTGIEASASSPALPGWFGPRASAADPAVSALIAGVARGAGWADIGGEFNLNVRIDAEPPLVLRVHRPWVRRGRVAVAGSLNHVAQDGALIERRRLLDAYEGTAPEPLTRDEHRWLPGALALIPLHWAATAGLVGGGIREAESAMTAAEAWWSRRAELSS